MKRIWLNLSAGAACALALAAPAAAQRNPTPTSVGNFGVYQETDPITDDNQSMAIVTSSDREREAAVAWQCWKGNTTVWVKLDRFNGGDVDAVYRFGTSAADSTVLQEEDGQTMYRLPEDLIYSWSQQAMTAPRLVLRVYDAEARSYDYFFDLAGSGRALHLLPCVGTLRPPLAGAPAADARKPSAKP